MNKIGNYFKGVGKEAKRVRWPHRKQLWTSVGIVMFITILSALLLYFEDWISSNILKGFDNMTSSSATSSSATAARIIRNFIGGFNR